MRNRHFLILDSLLLAALPALAAALRFEGLALPAGVARALIVYGVMILPVRLLIAYGFGLYRSLWPHASLNEVQRIAYAGAASALAAWIVGTVGLTATGLASTRLPYSVIALDALLAVGAFAGPRLVARFKGRRVRSASDRRAIVVGAGAAGQLILRETRLNDRLKVHIVGFADDDPYKQNQLLGGVPVVGTLQELPSLVSRYGADEVIIAMPKARGSVMRQVVRAATDAGVQVRVMPALDDLLTGKLKVSALRNVEIEDLLRREPIVTDLQAVESLAVGQPVLVTGAGGSIGSELCRQIAALSPSVLIALDHSENQIFEIHGELRERFPLVRVVPVIADVRNTMRIHRIVGRHKPRAIFHAAAHKHVPLMEDNLVEAITNNVLGTRNLVDAALDADVARLVNISTDKAVRPTSIMGATKRVAEKIVLHAALNENRNFVSVRFGNVLGSRGSVVPTFLKQIKEGGPITVTHPEMRRYFMTIPEAVQLVLQAGALGKGGELFVLDMGELIKIVDLARDLIRLSGLEEGVDVNIEYTGVRPGEKLFEELLFGGEDIQPTGHPKVLRSMGETAEPEVMESIDALIRVAASNAAEDADLRAALREIVPEFSMEDARTNPKLRRTPPPMRKSGGALTVDIVKQALADRS